MLEKKGQDKKFGTMSHDITTVFCTDAKEWDHYLAECFKQYLQPKQVSVKHEKLEDLTLPLPPARAKSFTDAKVVLVIISPDFLEFVEQHADIFELGKLLHPGRTVAMLCGVQEDEITVVHRAALPSYGSWPQLVARDQDSEFVLNVITTTCSIMQRAEESRKVQKPKFRLTPRKVQEGNNKIFVILNQPIQEGQKVQVILESSGAKEATVKWRNPYVLQFIVPDSLLQTSKMMNVHIRCDGVFLGVRQLKCESKLAELYNLLQSVTSPYEMLCLTMGLATLRDVDEALTRNFKQNLPSEGFTFLKPQQLLSERKRSEEVLPTLLHFSAHYGLKEFTSQLLQCPGASACCYLLNSKGQTPAQLANSAGHNDIAIRIDEFQKKILDGSTSPVFNSRPSSGSQGRVNDNPIVVQDNLYAGNPSYSLPVPCSPKHEESEYLSMNPLEPDFPETPSEDRPTLLPRDERSCNSLSNGFKIADDIKDDACPLYVNEIQFTNTQDDLIQMMELYKKGAPIALIDKLFEEWKRKNTSQKHDRELEGLREIYQQVQKQKSSLGKQTFSWSDLKQKLKARKGSRENSLKSTDLRDHDVKSSDIYRVSTLSSASTASSGSTSSSDRLSTVSSSSMYDSGTHSDTGDEPASRHKDAKSPTQNKPGITKPFHNFLDRPPAPPPRPPRLPVNRNSHSQPTTATTNGHNYYKFPPIPNNRSSDYITPDTGNYFMASDMENFIKNVKDSKCKSLDCREMKKSKSSNQNSRHRSRAGSSENIYYDIPPQLPRPVVNKRDPLIDYDFPPPSPRRVPSPGTSSNGSTNYYDIPKFCYTSKSDARLSIPDEPPPPPPPVTD